MKIYVIRHGEVDVNIKNQLNGRNESMLTEKGIKQAQNASIEVNNLDIDFIICSPLKRTKQTCELINKKKTPVIYDDRILERDTKSMMYKVKNNVNLNIFYSPENKIVFGDCEGFQSILDRIKDFIESIKLQYSNKNILIVTHNDVCKAIHCYINNVYDINEIINYDQNNCEIVGYQL